MSTVRTTWPWWLAGLAFALYPALRPYADERAARPRLLRVARGLAYAGAVGVLPYYGGEAFALHAVGAYATATADLALLSVVDGFRYSPVAITLFGVGLLAVAAAGVLAWVAAAGSGRRWQVAT